LMHLPFQENAPRPQSITRGMPPRPYSSKIGRVLRPPLRGSYRPTPHRKPVKPAEPLFILPTPHLLKEDAFASPISFAPGARVKDFRAGTASETASLRGGIRPYTPTVRAHTPLAPAFDELNVLPTP